MNSDQKEWEEQRFDELHAKVSQERRDARFSIEYYGERAAKLSSKIRWASLLAGLGAVLTAVLLLWVPKAGIPLAIIASSISLLSPACTLWIAQRGWREDLQDYRNAQSLSSFLEVEFAHLFNKLEIREYTTLDEMLRRYQNLMRRWELVSSAEPNEIRDDKLVDECQNRADRILGLENDNHDQKAKADGKGR